MKKRACLYVILFETILRLSCGCGWSSAPGASRPETDQLQHKEMEDFDDRYFYFYKLATGHRDQMKLLNFNTYDQNQDGRIDLTEILNSLKIVYDDYLKQMAILAFTDADVNGDFAISCQEFQNAPFWPGPDREKVTCSLSVGSKPPKVDQNVGPYEGDARIYCPEPFGNFLDPTNCRRWLHCNWGKFYIRKCPEGTLFDENLMNCNFEHLVTCNL